MKKLLLLTVLCMTLSNVYSQQGYELKFNAGANTTFIRDFKPGIAVASTEIIPGLNLEPGDYFSFDASGLSAANTSYKIGFFADGELYKTFWNGWKLSASLGVNQISYTYDFDSPVNNGDTTMKTLHPDFGNTRILYITSRFANVSRQLNNISFQLGPVFSYLVHSKINNAITMLDEEHNRRVVIAQAQGDGRKFLYGAHFNFKYKLAKPLEVMVASQYFFNSMYQKNGTAADMYKKSKPLQLQLGLSYLLAKF